MKQITKTPDIVKLLTNKVGSDVDVNSLAVFEAIALNTLPLRKMHPLYNTSRVDLGVLYEMAASLNEESIPMQVMHDKEVLPIGRVFHAEVKGSELRALFFLDGTQGELVQKIESGTVDQVSVSILPKHIYNSVSNFDYLGPDASFENVWTGTDNDGNTIGKNGVYGKLVGLSMWSEMSLVGKGGAQNARIIHRDSSYFGSSYEKLAASGVDPNAFVLVASVEDEDMDLTVLTDKLTANAVELSDKTREVVTLTASNAELKTENEKLKADLALATAEPEKVTADLTAATAKLTAAEADLKVATDALKDVAQKVLTASGKVNEKLPETVTELTALIGDTEKGLAATLVAGGRSRDASTDGVAQVTSLDAFRIRSRK